MQKLLYLALILVSTCCSPQMYEYAGISYRLYREMPDKAKANEVFALDLSKKGLTLIPYQLKNLHNLVFLNLTENEISVVGAEICELKNLKVILLKGNKLTEFDVCFAGLSSLEIISFMDCGLTSLPKDLSKLTKLKRLVLSGNSISENEINEIRLKLPECQIIQSVD